MKLTLSPTPTIENVNGVPHRVWLGTTDKCVKVKAWVAVVEPQTHDAAQLADFDRELRDVKCERHERAYDLRLFID